MNFLALKPTGGLDIFQTAAQVAAQWDGGEAQALEQFQTLYVEAAAFHRFRFPQAPVKSVDLVIGACRQVLYQHHGFPDLPLTLLDDRRRQVFGQEGDAIIQEEEAHAAALADVDTVELLERMAPEFRALGRRSRFGVIDGRAQETDEEPGP